MKWHLKLREPILITIIVWIGLGVVDPIFSQKMSTLVFIEQLWKFIEGLEYASNGLQCYMNNESAEP